MFVQRKPKKTVTGQGQTQTTTQEQTQPTEAQIATQEQPQPNETQIDVGPEFEMLVATLAAAFEATQTQPNLVVNGPVASAPSQPNHSAPVTSTQGELITSSQTDDVPIYILSALVPTIDDVLAGPSYTTPRVLKPVIPFPNDLELFC